MSEATAGSSTTAKEQKEKTEKIEPDKGDQPQSDLETLNRHTGAVKWYQVSKGYGFIIDDATGEDLFVHQSEIMMKGFRSLGEGERVSYFIRGRQGRDGREAWQVGAEMVGETLKGSSVRPIGKKKANLARCFKCGRFANHMAKDCDKPIQGKACYTCGDTAHLSTSCPMRAMKRRSPETIRTEREKQQAEGQELETSTSAAKQSGHEFKYWFEEK